MSPVVYPCRGNMPKIWAKTISGVKHDSQSEQSRCFSFMSVAFAFLCRWEPTVENGTFKHYGIIWEVGSPRVSYYVITNKCVKVNVIIGRWVETDCVITWIAANQFEIYFALKFADLFESPGIKVGKNILQKSLPPKGLWKIWQILQQPANFIVQYIFSLIFYYFLTNKFSIRIQHNEHNTSFVAAPQKTRLNCVIP